MMKKRGEAVGTDWRLGPLAGLIFAIGLTMVPTSAWAVVCTDVLKTADTGFDTDQDGFTDHQECSGITTVGEVQVIYPWCGATLADGTAPSRDRCVDPNSKDVFVILAPATAAPSLLPQAFNPFGPVRAYGITFSGLSGLRLAVHPLKPTEAGLNRVITSAVLNLPAQKAVRVGESLDTSSTTILGDCQWGMPLGLDGCVVYTQRTKNFIASSCGSATIQTPAGAVSDAADVLLAYSTQIILHETGHSLGGLTGEYTSRFGGYHYKAGSGLVMDQAVTYTVKGSKCTFYMSPNWNQTLDPPAVKLINP
jgi:hypothetical protein